MSMIEARLNELIKREDYVTKNLIELLGYLKDKKLVLLNIQTIKKEVNMWCMDNYKMDLYDSFVEIVEILYKKIG